MGYFKKAENKLKKLANQYTEGLITQGEKYNKVVDIWAKATDDVADEMMEAMKRHRYVREDDRSG